MLFIPITKKENIFLGLRTTSILDEKQEKMCSNRNEPIHVQEKFINLSKKIMNGQSRNLNKVVMEKIVEITQIDCY